MAIILITALAIISIGVVIYPFLQTVQRGHNVIDDSWQHLRRSRNRVYEDIKILHQERFLGHLSDQEFQDQLVIARTLAARYMKQQHDLQQSIDEAQRSVDCELKLLEDHAVRAVSHTIDHSKDQPN